MKGAGVGLVSPPSLPAGKGTQFPAAARAKIECRSSADAPLSCAPCDAALPSPSSLLVLIILGLVSGIAVPRIQRRSPTASAVRPVPLSTSVSAHRRAQACAPSVRIELLELVVTADTLAIRDPERRSICGTLPGRRPRG